MHLPSKLLLFGALATFVAAQTKSINNNLPANWTHIGCYTEGTNGRALIGSSYTNNTGMTETSCIKFCNSTNFIYAGIEYGQECYCGNGFKGGAAKTAAGECNMGCSGNSSELCGAGNRLNVFWNGQPEPLPPITNPGVGKAPYQWGSVGCYSDNVNGRALPNGVQTKGGAANMTISLCVQACNATQGMTYAGAEYGGECFCGTSIANGGAKVETGCDMLCNGNQSEFCGGPNRLNVYHLGEAVSSGSQTPSSSWTTATGTTPVTDPDTPPTTSSAVRTSSAATTTAAASSSKKTSISSSRPATSAKTSSSSKSSTASKSTASPQPSSSASRTSTSSKSSSSSKPTSSSSSTKRSSASSSAAQTSASSTAVASTSSSAASSTAAVSSSAVVSSSSAAASSVSVASRTSSAAASSVSQTLGDATALPAGWNYQGCYIDNRNGRILVNQQGDDQQITVETCVAKCRTAGYSVAGIEYSTQCFCGNAIIQGGSKGAEADCNMPCGGNQNQHCGGPNRMSIYASGTLQTVGIPQAQNSSLPGNYKYAGCFTEGQGVRALPWQIQDPRNNSATNCCTQCAKFGYRVCAMEYGEECYCGDESDMAAVGSVKRPDSECATACPGNATTICGDGNRLTTFIWENKDSPLYVWNYASGANAGEYRNLIGGVVIPLITTTGINGKITFTEKHGTSQQPNSTGAWELDPSRTDNFNLAWRELQGLKTDVFCSAGLILPDRAGRQLNIGGWSGDSTYGIRLYTPDGKPGVQGTNGWEENFQEIHLQSGRWYPSALQLLNGSILVMGGQEGSNGEPVPSLELLPKAGGVIELDWLRRTNPNNLYPFLSILPSGNVFVSYYNEARILDARTFNTIKQLPNIPGSVISEDSGRTYPFEGTSMLLPQSAPYTAPLEVLICGGSGPGAGLALDNCVTTQPEAASPKWTIERMPSKRVMTCIVALPDGTYLINNGARQGVAGFGLATKPNLNAVLYDPSKPLGQRMTVMANTTVARMYHSESLLMDDGRVLVTGSDPEDGTNPQEYRVEVFMPPYLLNGQARPSYTIANRDWAYGSSYQVTVSGAGNRPIKASLLAAVSSTHGNSMGQRTIFPAISCSGGSCSITAPPRAGVAPNGWYQLFILADGTPSVAQWVRIGGDPASIGNWPNTPSFTKPGVGAIAQQ